MCGVWYGVEEAVVKYLTCALISLCLGLRKNDFPAGPDTYREYVYERDDANSGFRVVETPADSMATVE